MIYGYPGIGVAIIGISIFAFPDIPSEDLLKSSYDFRLTFETSLYSRLEIHDSCFL